MTLKTLAEIETNFIFMPFPEADKIGKRELWYEKFRSMYRRFLKAARDFRLQIGKSTSEFITLCNDSRMYIDSWVYHIDVMN